MILLVLKFRISCWGQKVAVGRKGGHRTDVRLLFAEDEVFPSCGSGVQLFNSLT